MSSAAVVERGVIVEIFEGIATIRTAKGEQRFRIATTAQPDAFQALMAPQERPLTITVSDGEIVSIEGLALPTRRP